MSFAKLLNRFLTQAGTGELKVEGKYPKEFEGLNMVVSFGKGNVARIPWIALLKGENKVSNGIYPVLLYYKDRGILVLAYGVSETTAPKRNWNINDAKTIKEYFSSNDFGKPERYGLSKVFRIYDVGELPPESEINADIDLIIQVYHKQGRIASEMENSSYTSSFHRYLLSEGLLFSPELVVRFCASLQTKPFVILTGLSGSGKTKLATSFASWISTSPDQYCLVPVGADWTNRDHLLGYPNALKDNSYMKPENGALDLIIRAGENENLPYFLILDEMNLSHVERYFADFLSVMEMKEDQRKINLHAESSDLKEVALPLNLFIIGTVNIDETTYMFSPKVLDRANVIEFRVKPKDMSTYLDGLQIAKNEGEIPDIAALAKDFVKLAKRETKIGDKLRKQIATELKRFFEELQNVGAEFGYRTASEIIRFAYVVRELDPLAKEEWIIDAAIMQKLLPKLHGSRKKLSKTLEALAILCTDDKKSTLSIVNDKVQINIAEGKANIYPISLEKILRMYQSLLDNGFASYAEA